MKHEGGSRRASFFLDFLLIFLLTAILIWPLFKAKYLDKWASIESTFIADARFLKEHWPHPLWQPLWYGGTRFDYIYPPALRYGTAAIAKFYPMAEARAYHIYIAFFYCMGIAGVYLLARIGSGSRGAAWLAAAGSALLSPCFLFLPEWSVDYWLHHPIRLGVMVRYGEGPHMTAFAWLPIALAASLLALEEWRPGAMAAAAICCALVVSNNFYGAVALAMSYPILAWSLWITQRPNQMWLRTLVIPALAYGLTAFWLSPSYLRVTTYNLNLVSEPGNTWSICVALAAVVVFAVVTGKWARGRRELTYLIFAAGLALFFGLDVIGNHFWNFRVVGEPGRLTPELDLIIILLAAEALWRVWARDTAAWRALALGIVLVSFATALPYARRSWQIIVTDMNYKDRVEYKLTEWMGDHLPGARTLATGSVRFWYDAWRDLAQLGGGSDQGVLNQRVSMAYTSITNDDVRQGLLWMQAFGVDAVIVHDKNSQEYYHDFVYPRAFAGTMPVEFDNRAGDVIYRVPRRFPDLARVVEKSRVVALPQMTLKWEPATMAAYVEALEKGPDARAVTRWEGTDSMRIEADVAVGQSVLAQVSYDPEWRAVSNGRALEIRRDALGQMLIETPPGHQKIRLTFETPLENRIGRVVSMLSALVVLILAVSGMRRERRS